MATYEKPFTNICHEPTTVGNPYKNAQTEEHHYQSSIQPPLLPSPRNVPERYEPISIKAETETINSQRSPYQIKQEKPQSKTKSLRLPSRQTILGVCIVVLITVILAETSILLVHHKGGTAERPEHEAYITTQTAPTMPPRPSSCLELKESGYPTGIYTVTNLAMNFDYKVYCDMDTDGGGWTLVASVHEDDITRKCDANDRWSSYARDDSNNRVYSAWENKVTFGNVLNATSDDYKNEGYFLLQSDNIMIWHVESGTPLEYAKNRSTLRYRSSNKFLRRLGGNLYSVFTEYFQLNIRRDYCHLTESEMRQRTRKVVGSLEKNGNVIKSHIPNWYPYELTYNKSDSFILNDGLYAPYGNEIHVSTPSNYRIQRYDEEFWWDYPDYTSMLARRSHPFIMVTVIGNENEALNIHVRTQVYSLHRQYLNTSSEQNVIELGNFKLRYHSFQILVNNSATACEYIFNITNKKEWRSIDPRRIDVDISIGSSTRSTNTYIEGSPTNVISGYLLLTRQQGLPFTKQMLDDVATTILSTIAEIPTLFNEFAGSDGLIVPIAYDKGSGDSAFKMVPEILQRGVEDGYLQLRAYNRYGFANALCPGIKVNSPLAEYICIGGVSNYTERDVGTCGDFAGWHGRSDTVGENGRSEYAHSDEDVNSVLLIFYR